MIYYVLLVDDRHADIDVKLYGSAHDAIMAALPGAVEAFNRFRDVKADEDQVKRMGYTELNSFMIADSWCWYLNTYDDGPTFKVLKRVVQ